MDPIDTRLHCLFHGKILCGEDLELPRGIEQTMPIASFLMTNHMGRCARCTGRITCMFEEAFQQSPGPVLPPKPPKQPPPDARSSFVNREEKEKQLSLSHIGVCLSGIGAEVTRAVKAMQRLADLAEKHYGEKK